MTPARLTTVLASLALILGLGHLSLLLAAPSGWSERALWFAGTGLAIVVAAVLNLIGRHVPGRTASGLAIGACNLALAGFFAAAWPLLMGPQVVVGGLLFAVLAGLTLLRGPATNHS